MKINSTFLKNKMEIINWDKTKLPAMIYFHSKDNYLYKLECQHVFSHWHKELEITGIFNGDAIFFNNGNEHVITGCGVNITNPEEVHSIIYKTETFPNDNEIAGISLQISDEFLKWVFPESGELNFFINEKLENIILQKLYRIYKLYTEMDCPGNNIRIYAVLCDIMADLYENGSSKKGIITLRKKHEEERCKEVIDYINLHYDENLLQQDIAKKFNFSREYFARFFKRQTGMTFKEYHTRYRIQKAAEDVLHTNKSIQRIAMEHGFSSETQFICYFKKEFGITPLKYRKSNCLEKDVE